MENNNIIVKHIEALTSLASCETVGLVFIIELASEGVVIIVDVTERSDKSKIYMQRLLHNVKIFWLDP